MSNYVQMEFDLRLSPEASLARTYPRQAGALESSTGIDPLSGRRCYDSPEMYTQRGLLRKMYQPCDLKGLPWSYKISARSGMWENFIVYPLVPVAALRIKGTESGLLPTPDASPRGPRSPDLVLNRSTVIRRGSSQKRGIDLQTYVRMWPTPTSMDGKRTGKELDPDSWLGAKERHAKKGVNKHFHLDIAVQFAEQKRWPTPTSRDWKDGSAKSCRNVPANCLLGREVHAREDYQTTGSLNPQWVEWLMGYPDGWTDLNSLETP